MDKVETKLQKLNEMIQESKPEELAKHIQKLQKLMAYYKCAMLEVETKFKVLDEEFSLKHERNPIDSIKSRIKSLDSIIEKLQRKGHPMTIDSIEETLSDIAGIRIICAFVDDIYLLVDCIAAQDDVVIVEKKDYIKNPKSNGYRSLHLIIQIPIFLEKEKRNMRVEVQLRTIAMELWANLEHRVRYKKNVAPAALEQTSDHLLECAQLCDELDRKMHWVREMVDAGTEATQHPTSEEHS